MPAEKKALFYYETFVGGGVDLTTTTPVERDVADLIGRRGSILRATVTGTGTVDVRINDNSDLIRLTGNAPENDWTFDSTRILDVNVREQAQIAFIKITLVTGTPTLRVFVY